ncbi:hypothetical protein HHL16_03945 [Pseudoflavitalea sp. G-6-1-2]|uniref:hypothetical protein n=1 Tax=Pseudoflavitalea sp. G-6-1-2 TaxID=2728841 RepID=UPI00146E2C4D|nr:hypothetical protein [Pseudoflavitalea sp. G-6-1-2]NML20010.1 hypothetical protein [Pseudoflavitalea sp. G-6-1-2]
MPITTYIKRLIYPLYIYQRITSAKRKELRRLFDHFRKPENNLSLGSKLQIQLFSNMEEDGIILRLIASLGIEKGYFIDIGSNDCINSNCANLAFNFEWKGVFVDADEKLLKIGKRNYRFFNKETGNRFVQSFLTAENINSIIKENSSTEEIDFLNIDIDGDDYAIWKAIDCIQPKIVLVENKIEYGTHDIIVPATEPFLSSEWGASLVSFNKLANQKGYSLVATNREGFNAFFMRNDCLKTSGLQVLSVVQVLNRRHIKNSFYSQEVMMPLIESCKREEAEKKKRLQLSL